MIVATAIKFYLKKKFIYLSVVYVLSRLQRCSVNKYVHSAPHTIPDSRYTYIILVQSSENHIILLFFSYLFCKK